MFNPNSQSFSNDRMQQAQREAAMQRLAQAATAQPGITNLSRRVLNATGQMLVATGHSLLQKGKPQTTEWEYIGRLAS